MTFRGAIPSAITILNLASGTLAIILLDLFWSPILILLAGVFDLFDGAAARWLNVESEFGKELDSLCDMISFGVAPACVYYLLVPNENYWLIAIPVIYTIAAAIRLATFNTLPKSDEFRGLASPPAALFITGLAFAVYHGEQIITSIIESTSGYVILGLLPAMAMISKRRMFAFKGIGDAQTRWWFIILAIAVVAVAIYDYRLAVPAAILLYVIFAELRNLLT